MVIPISFGWRDKIDGVEWRGVLVCEPCSRETPEESQAYTPHTGYKAKRQGTLYRLPVAPLGKSSLGYIRCDRCGDGNWYKGEDFQELGRAAARNAAEWDAQKHHQEDIRRREEEALGVDGQRQLGLTPYGEGWLVKGWCGDEQYVRLETILRNPKFFILTEQQMVFAERWQQANPLPEPPVRPFCSECGQNIIDGDHTPECGSQGVLLS